jgi:hypothetical protein
MQWLNLAVQGLRGGLGLDRERGNTRLLADLRLAWCSASDTAKGCRFSISV